MACTYRWKYLPHDCTAAEVRHCRRRCRQRERPYCGCIVVAEMEFHCRVWRGGTLYAWGGKQDFTHCCCKTRRPPRRVRKRRRREFNRHKARLIEQWQRRYDAEWPIDPKTGWKVDAHHIEELQYGGSNTLENLMPIPSGEHSRVHAAYRRCMAACP